MSDVCSSYLFGPSVIQRLQCPIGTFKAVLPETIARTAITAPTFLHVFGQRLIERVNNLGSLADAVQYLEDRDTNTGKGRHDLPFPLSPTGRDAPMLTELPRGPHKPLASRDKQTSIRSEERRVGTECVSPCRSRLSPYH